MRYGFRDHGDTPCDGRGCIRPQAREGESETGSSTGHTSRRDQDVRAGDETGFVRTKEYRKFSNFLDLPQRPSGTLFMNCWCNSGSCISAVFISVAYGPG